MHRFALALALPLCVACGRSGLGTPSLDGEGGSGVGGGPSGGGDFTTATGSGGSGGEGASLLTSVGSGGAPSTSSSGTGGEAGICGDGALDPGEQCDLGAANVDRPALELTQGLLRRAVRPVDRQQTAPSFYGYFSASSHTGFEALFASRMFFYRNLATGFLTLFTHHGIDANTSGLNQPSSQVRFDFTNLPSTSIVGLSDEPGELTKLSPTTARGEWAFQNNSDGGILAGFPFPGSWSFDIAPAQFSNGISDWAFVDGDETLQPLAMQDAVTLTAHGSPSACRLDCTVPFCGDGVVDGGEECDGTPGCGANCTIGN